MPDGLTHIISGYVCSERWLKEGRLALFLLGGLIPDLLLRGGRLLFICSTNKDFFELYLTPLHTPITSLFICLAIAQFFHPKIQKQVFALVFSGCVLHFIMDLFQLTINGYGFSIEPLDGYNWFFPLTWFDFQLGFFWPEETPYSLIILFPAAFFLFLYRKNRKN
jgi:hypothetical protein